MNNTLFLIKFTHTVKNEKTITDFVLVSALSFEDAIEKLSLRYDCTGSFIDMTIGNTTF